jgi:hypothetical protein
MKEENIARQIQFKKLKTTSRLTKSLKNLSKFQVKERENTKRTTM